MKRTVTTSASRHTQRLRVPAALAACALLAAAVAGFLHFASDGMPEVVATHAERDAPPPNRPRAEAPALPHAAARPRPPTLLRPRAPILHALFNAQEASAAPDDLPVGAPEPAPRPSATADGGEDGASRAREPALFAQLRNHRDHPVPEQVRALAREITQACTNDASRARAIYDWITANIKYDTAEWRNIVSGADSYAHPHDPASVLERGTTVCIGYAWLFDDMCEAAGLESTFLIGDVRGYRGTPDEELVSNVRHAWSAVREDGEWKLLDATWGARQAGETDADYKARADYYFDTPPGQFIFDHLPEHASWQLLENPLPSKAAFDALPNLKPAFFTDGLRLGGDYTATLGAHTGARYRLPFAKPAGTQVAFTLGPADGSEARQIRGVASQSGEAVAAVIPPLAAGDHLLRVYSRTGTGPYTCAADFIIHVEP